MRAVTRPFLSDVARVIAVGSNQSPGELFAQAYAQHGERAEVHFDYTITDAFQPGKERPRWTVRNLFNKRPVPPDTDTVRTWCESRPAAGEAERVRESDLRREAAFRFGMAKFPVETIRGWVQLPPELAGDAEALARFIEFRQLRRGRRFAHREPRVADVQDQQVDFHRQTIVYRASPDRTASRS